MTLLACGINHQTAPVSLREQVAFSPERAKSALQELLGVGVLNEAMILSTCNRVEIYGDSQSPGELRSWLQHKLPSRTNAPWYLHEEQQAVLHIMRVASGLDSMVLGEPQILGQLKDAFALAKEAGSVGIRLQRLFQRVLNVSKQVRTDTKVGANPITLGFAAVSLAKKIFSDLTKKSVLLIGAGEIIESAALHLFNQGVKRFIIASRQSERAVSLASKLYGHGITFVDIPLYLAESDIIISATASDRPLLSKEMTERAIKARKHRPIFMVDLAVPRDIEPEIANLEDVYLYNIDDLRSVVEDSRQLRKAEAKEAESIIELQAGLYMREVQSLDANHLICQFRERLISLSKTELQRAFKDIEQGKNIEQTLNNFAHNLINKISHTPCAQMKQAAYDGRPEILALARQLLGIE